MSDMTVQETIEWLNTFDAFGSSVDVGGVQYINSVGGWKLAPAYTQKVQITPTSPSIAAMNSNWWTSPATNVEYVPDVYGGYDSNKDKWKYCNHKWIDTGMVRTYCKHCDVRGNKNAMSGEVTVVPDDEEDKDKKK